MKKNKEYSEDRSNKVNESMGNLPSKTFIISSIIIVISVVILWLIIFQFKYTYEINAKLLVYKTPPLIEKLSDCQIDFSGNNDGFNCDKNDVRTELFCLAGLDSLDVVNIIKNQNINISINNDQVLVGRILSILKINGENQMSYLIKIGICCDSEIGLTSDENNVFPLNGIAKIKCSRHYYIIGLP